MATTPSQIIAALQPYLIPANRVNASTPGCKAFGGPCDIYVYKIPGTNPAVLVFTASGSVDCDGKLTAICNENTDDGYQPQTSFEDSKGQPLDASVLPWYVLPVEGSTFRYSQNGIAGGQVGLVMYGNKSNYGVFGDENGTSNKFGEVSYAMAQSLGINPNPITGGVASGVTYIIFTGAANRVNPIEDHNKTVSMGDTAFIKLMQQLGQNLSPPEKNTPLLPSGIIPDVIKQYPYNFIATLGALALLIYLFYYRRS